MFEEPLDNSILSINNYASYCFPEMYSTIYDAEVEIITKDAHTSV